MSNSLAEPGAREEAKTLFRSVALLLLLAATWAPVPARAATPVVSSVTGTLATGETLTLSGAHLVDEDRTHWDSFFTTWPNSYGFEGSDPRADGYCAISGACLGSGEYDTTVKLMGSRSIRFHTETRSSGTCDSSIDGCNRYNSIRVNDEQNEIWVRFYSRWNLISGAWPNSHIKMLYDMTAGYYFQPNASADGLLPTHMIAKGVLPDIGRNEYLPIPSGRLQNGRWYLYEVHWTVDGPHTFDAWMDNKKIIWANGDPAASSLLILHFGMVNTGAASPFSLDEWIDGLALGTSRIYPASLVEIGSGPAYDPAAVKYQEPVYLSDGSVQIKVDLTGLGAGPYCLWVTNNRQERSAPHCTGTLPDGGVPGNDASVPDASPRPDATVPGADAQVLGPDGGIVGAVTDLSVAAMTTSAATLSFTEVDDGTSHPASYVVRFAPTPIAWGTATPASQGTCSSPMAGGAMGAARSCTLGGLSPGLAYDFQLVPFRGTLQVDAIFGPLSNVAQGTSAVEPGPDAGAADANSCVARGACTSPDGCRSGTLECLTGQATCAYFTDSPNGTPCPGSGVCYAGSCRYCRAGDGCTSIDGCRSGTIDCATGEALCTGLTNQPEGIACAAGTGICQSGVCSVCKAGESCTSVDGCQAGGLDCSKTPAVCGSLGNRSDGTACTGGACLAGVCHPCTPGATCSASEECKAAAIDCSTGEPACRVQSHLADGTPCSTGRCRSGRCEADADAGDPCGPGTHWDSATGKCLPNAIPDSMADNPISAGCGCGAGTGADVSFLFAGLVALRSCRRRGSSRARAVSAVD